MLRARHCSRDPYTCDKWWPWDQACRNRLIAFMLWVVSKYCWHHRTFLRAVSLLDRVVTSLPCSSPSPEYHRALLGATALSVAYKFEEGRPTDERWAPQANGVYTSKSPLDVWVDLAHDVNTCFRLTPAVTAACGGKAELALLRELAWDLHYELPLHALLREVPTENHRDLFRVYLLLRTASFLTAPRLDVVGLVRYLLAGNYGHPDVSILRQWLATTAPHPTMQLDRCYLRQDFPRLYV